MPTNNYMMNPDVQQKKARTRDKEGKITSIIEATTSLIEANGYGSVTTRDIAKAAGVSNGLVFKYFPGGKPEIVKVIVSRKFVLDILNIYMPDSAKFNDFQGYLRKALSDSIAYARKHHEIYTALTIASLSDKNFFEGLEDMIIVDDTAMKTFLGNFKGINLNSRKNPREFTTQWLEVLNAMIMHHIFYPSAFVTDEKLVDMLVEISVKLWDYHLDKKN